VNNRQINLYDAKSHLSRLVDDAAAGESIIIAKDGKPMARLGPIRQPSRRPRQLGQLAHHTKDIDWTEWWRDWKAADKAIEADFDRAAAEPLASGRAKPARRRRERR